MTAADMASISEQPDVYQELVEASFIFSTIMEVLPCTKLYTLIIVVVQEILFHIKKHQWEFILVFVSMCIYACIHVICMFLCVCVWFFVCVSYLSNTPEWC